MASEPFHSGAVSTPATEAATPPEALAAELRTLRLSDPLHWLALGWRDFIRCPGLGLFYGAAFVAMGHALMWVFQEAPAYVLALSAGFLLVGPFLALGLYQASRHLERGEQPDLGDSLLAWDTRTGTLALFGGVLLVLEMIWGRAAMVVFAVSFDGMPDFKGSLLMLADPEHIGFTVTYLAVGAIFAGLIYGVSVVSIPMILDRQTDAITAGLTSLRLCLAQPGVMLFWGALITGLVVVAMLPWFAGLLVVGPWLGHASWHAYRGAVIAAEPPAAADQSAGAPRDISM
ncbi:DUF2189 domain-containing protein [Azohydromonas caseinilytica]|uniref:DUF2189 domain-containing protein n=1 Tax=Azohydromonas caseinilytica TaxID=2728836 RepID=A0A848FAL4_9BURK|nr:DUF2189 domain-containing protein [Azohydromonas caseinilytica]NML15011.1 DUF2189 domain-containing protein [Azohydromonas caseinilytica]